MEADEALSQLVDQIPKPHAVSSGSIGCSLQQLALLTREFNSAMGLPEGTTMKIVSHERGQQDGRMLLEEVREIEEAIKSGIAHDVLAELTDVIYLTLNLGQECGLQDWLEDAFLVKHSDNLRKQHDSVTHLSWTRTAHARACKCTEESLNFTLSPNQYRQMVAILQWEAYQALRLWESWKQEVITRKGPQGWDIPRVTIRLNLLLQTWASKRHCVTIPRKGTRIDWDNMDGNQH